jgi:hypothetical protein
MIASPTTTNVSLHGFTVKSHVPICALESAAKVDLITSSTNSEGSVPNEWPTIAQSISTEEPGHVLMKVSGQDSEFLVEWPGLLSACLSRSSAASELRFRVPPTVTPNFESLLISPAVGTLSMLNGNLVLHGSTVAIDGSGVVLLAEAGGGKSSVTAMLCSAGGHIVSEDVSVLTSMSTGETEVFSGVHELRMRDTNTWITELPGLNTAGAHADGRIVLRPRATQRPQTSVKTIAVVQLTHDARSVTAIPIPPTRAVATLMAFQRTPVLATHPLAATMFDAAIKTVSRVNVIALMIPWSIARRTPLLAEELRESLSRN